MGKNHDSKSGQNCCIFIVEKSNLENEDFRPWNGWVFRGHKDYSYNLSTTLERLLLNKEKEYVLQNKRIL